MRPVLAPRIVYCDKNGKPLPSLTGLKVGDTIYTMVMGKLAACQVVKLSPFTVKSK